MKNNNYTRTEQKLISIINIIKSIFNNPWEVVVTLLISMSLFCLSYPALGQICYQNTYGGSLLEETRSIIQTQDGNIVFAGRTMSNGSKEQAYITKTDQQGSIIWSKTIGDQVTSLMANDIIENNDGSIIVTGYTYGFGIVNDSDILLTKLDKDGNVVWSRVIIGGMNEYGSALSKTNDNGYFITGSSYSTGGGLTDIVLIKTDSNGNMLWNKTYGGLALDNASDIKSTPDGGAIITGFTTSKGSGSKDVFAIRTDAQGDTLWTKTYGSTNADQAWGVCLSPHGGFAIAGDTKSFGQGDGEIYVLRIDDNGNLLWEKSYGTQEEEKAMDIISLTDGSFLLTGTQGSWNSNINTALALKLDTNGNQVWGYEYTGTGYSQGTALFPTSDGGFMIAGNTQASGSYDALIIKADENGQSWCNQQAISFNDLSGTSNVGSGLNQSIGGLQYSPQNMQCIDLVNHISSFCYNCKEPESNFSYSINHMDVAFTELSIGAQTYNWQFGDGNTSTAANPTHNYTSYNTNQVCLEVENVCGIDTTCHNIEIIDNNTSTSIGELNDDKNIRIFPIPAQDHIIIDINEDHTNNAYSLNVYNIIGQNIIHQLELEKGANKINTDPWITGKYFYTINKNDSYIKNGVIIKK